jgi:ribosome maturation factor RimP
MDGESAVSRIWNVVAPLAEAEGLEVVDIEIRPEGRIGRVLRVYLDKEGGPNLDDLTRVSRQLSDLLDAHDLLRGTYTLEVSSPGINRLLKQQTHFERYVGKRIRVRTREMIENRRSFLGLLKEATGAGIVISQDGREVSIPFSLIERANYEHDWSVEKRRKMRSVNSG